MKVQIDTKDQTVYVQSNHIAKDLEAIDGWIKVLRIARKWLAEELKKGRK